MPADLVYSFKKRGKLFAMTQKGIICPVCNDRMRSVRDTIQIPGGILRYRVCGCGYAMPTVELQKDEIRALEAILIEAGYDPELLKEISQCQRPTKRIVVTRKTSLRDFAQAIRSQSRRARRQGVLDTLTIEEWADILSQTDWLCAMCGSDREIEIEHMIPISRGGNNSKENVCPLCSDCNGRKGAMMPLEWVFSRS